MQNPSAEANQQEFQDEQLKLLDSISDERPENVLEAAKNIGLITDGIRDKIEKDLPNHAMHFRLNLTRESSKGSPEVAFRRAFMATYGKFLLEQQTEVAKPDGEYVGVLNKVLRPENKIGGHGLNGRTELQAAGAMLHMMTSSKVAREDIQRRITAKEAEKASEEAKRPPLEADNALLDGKLPNVDAIKVPDGFEDSVARLNISYENREYVDRMVELRDMLGYFETTVKTNLVPSFPDAADKITDAINRFDAMVGATKINIDELKALLEENVKLLLRELRKEKPYKGDDGKYPDHDAYKANLDKADICFKFLNKGKNVAQLEARKTNTKDEDLTASGETTEYACFRKENETNFKGRYDAFKAQLVALNPDIIRLADDPALDASISGVNGFKKKCEDYLAAFLDFYDKDAADLTPAEVKAFIDDTFKPFAVSLRQLIDSKKLANNQALAQVATRISAIESDIMKLQTFDGTKIEENIQKEIETEEGKLALLTTPRDEVIGRRQPLLDAKNLAIQNRETTITERNDILQRESQAEASLNALISQKREKEVDSEELGAVATKFTEFETRSSTVFASFTDIGHKIDQGFKTAADSKQKRIDDLQAELTKLEAEIAELEAKAEKKLAENSDVDLLKGLDKNNLGTIDAGLIEALEPKLNDVDLARRFLNFKPDTILSRESVQKRRTQMLGKYHPDDYEGDSAKHNASEISKLIRIAAQTLISAIDENRQLKPKNIAISLQGLNAEIQSKKSQAEALSKSVTAARDSKFDIPDNLFVPFDSLKAFAEEVKSYSQDSDLNALCDGYLSAYSDIETKRNNGTLTAEDLKLFVTDKVTVFQSQLVTKIQSLKAEALAKQAQMLSEAEAFNSPIDSARVDLEAVRSEKVAVDNKLFAINTDIARIEAEIAPFDAQIAQFDQQIEELNEKIKNLKSLTPLQWILRKAFPVASPEEKQRAQRAVVDRKKDLEKGQKAREYFADSTKRKELETARQKLDKDSLTDVKDPNSVKKLKLKDAAGIETEYSYLEVPLDITIQRLEEQIKERRETRDRKDRNGQFVETQREAITLQINELQKHISELNALKKDAKAMHASMKNFSEHTANLIKLKIIATPSGAEDIEAILKELETLDVESPNLKCQDLITIYGKLDPYYKAFGDFSDLTSKFDEEIPKLESAVKAAEQKVLDLEAKEKASKNLTDPQAAKRIVSAIIAEQFPDMPLEEQQKLATLILAENVSTIQTLESYEALAKKGSAELLNTVQAAAIKQKLIGLEFQVSGSDKPEQPFKGLKPENFSTPAEIEKLFASGRLNHQNGFLVLAAFEQIGGDICAQSVFLRKRLKTALAEKLKVQDKMDEAGKNKIVDKSFEKSLKKARDTYKAYSDHFDANKDTWNLYAIQQLDLKFDKLEELHKLGLKDEIYYKRRAELLKEAREGGVEGQVKFAEDSAFAGYWSSKESQWVKDLGYNAGAYAGRKAGAVGKMGLNLTGRALWGTTKVAAGTAYQLGIATPLRVGVKYPAMIAGKVAAFPFRMVNNFFRKTKWGTPFELGKTVKADLVKTLNYFPETAGKVVAGAKTSLKEVPKKAWGEAQWKGGKYKDRTKIDQKVLDEHIKELEEKAKRTAVVLGESPYIDLTPFEKEIEQTNQMLGGTGGASEVKKAA